MAKISKPFRAFYKHCETGEIVVLEKRADGIILSSCPATEPLRDLDSYECKPDNNLWLQENSDKLILLE
jgi:hypothetical protein